MKLNDLLIEQNCSTGPTGPTGPAGAAANPTD